ELLRELGVTPEESGASLRPTSYSTSALSPFTERMILEHIAEAATEDAEAWLEDLDTMRREVDSIVRQVIRLIKRGGLEPSLKEDVMVVLRALRSRASATRPAIDGEIASIESNAAMLHFCRIILRLSETTVEE
ncbi:MAG TPA: hypothetical protein VGT44_17790, partial [Ktedonobacteraceae bacterium]|nr:hypothetical protein [Ktedonobacteraceae bacterium]